MRRGPLLLLLLIVLMTLRGLVGPAMAASMALPHAAVAAPSQHSAADHAAHGEDHADGMTRHCHDEAFAPTSHGGSHADSGCASGTSTHAACADCEICHTALGVPAHAALSPPGQPAECVRAPASRFASAPAALAIKPPIS